MTNIKTELDPRFSDTGGEGIAHVFAVRPEKVLAFGKNPFTHTRHVFGAG